MFWLALSSGPSWPPMRLQSSFLWKPGNKKTLRKKNGQMIWRKMIYFCFFRKLVLDYSKRMGFLKVQVTSPGTMLILKVTALTL